MAYIANKNQTKIPASTSFTVPLPIHKSGDLLMAFMGNNYSTVSYSAAASGWTELHNYNGSNNVAVFTLNTTSNNEIDPTFTAVGTQRAHSLTVLVIRDTPATNSISASSMSTYVNTIRTSCPTITPPDANTLVIEYCFCGSDLGLLSEGELKQVAAIKDSNKTIEYMLSEYTHELSNVATPPHYYTTSYGGNRRFTTATIAIKDNGLGNIKGQVSPYNKPALLVAPFRNGVSTVSYHQDSSKQVDCTSIIPTINGSTTTYKPIGGWDSLDVNGLTGTGGFTSNTVSDQNKFLVNQTGLKNPLDCSNGEILSFSMMARIKAGSVLSDASRMIGFGSGDLVNVATAAKLYDIEANDTKKRTEFTSGKNTYLLQPNRATNNEYASLDHTNITKVFTATYMTSDQDFGFGFIFKQYPVIALSGSATYPCNYKDLSDFTDSNNLYTISSFGSSVFESKHSIQLGDTSHSLKWNSSFQAIAFPEAYSFTDKNIENNIASASLLHNIKVATGDTIIMDSCTCNMGDFHRWEIDAVSVNEDIYSFIGLSILNATVTLQDKPLIDYSGITFSGCKELTLNGADLSGGNTISNCVDLQAVTVTNETEYAKLANCTFNSNNIAILIIGDQSGSWADTNLTMSGNTVDIEYTGTTNFSIQSANAITVNNSSTGVLTVVTPTVNTGLDFTGLIAGSQVVIFETGTQTEIQRNNNSTTQETWSELYVADKTVDYTIQKAGYAPIRVTGIVAGGSVRSVAVQQKIDRAYESGVAFTYTTDGAYVGNTFTLTKVMTVQKYYSAMIDSFIAQAALANTQFLITPNGGNSFSFDDCTIDEPDLLQYLYRDGIRVTASGVVTLRYAAILSQGAVGTDIAEIQQVIGNAPTTYTRGGTAVKSWNVPLQTEGGVVDCLVPVYKLGTGAFDYTGYMVIEYAKAGKYQNRVKVHDVYGSINDELYVIAVASETSPITGADPVLASPPVITRHAPVLWNGKNFSITITDSVGTNTASDIAQWINWNIREENDTAFNGDDPLNYYDYIKDDGNGWRTNYGEHLGFGLAGVRVVQNDGTTAHAGFTRMQSDDQSYYVLPITANGSITNLVAGSRVRILNITQATETFNAVVAGTNYAESYTDGGTYANGDILKIVIAYQSGVTAKALQTLTAVATSSGWSALASQVADTTYNTNGIDGSLVVGYSADYVADADGLNIDIQVAGSTFNILEGYAWYVYNLMTANGLALFADVMYAKDTGNYVFNTDVANVQIDNTGTQNLLETSLAVLSRLDGTDPRRNPPTGGFGISMNVGNVLIANVGGSSLTASEKAELSAINGITGNMVFTKANELDVNVLTSVDSVKISDVHKVLDLDSAKPNTYADDASSVVNSDFILTKTDNGNGSFKVQRS